MRNFKSYVKSNPNDAVPNIRSTPEILSFVSDLTHEVKVLGKYLKDSVLAHDEFFDVYKLVMEKQSILSNIRVLYKTKFEATSDIDPATVTARLDKLNYLIADTLSENLSNLSSSTGKIPSKINVLLHKTLQSLSYQSASIVSLPSEDRSNLYTACVSGVQLSSGSSYQDFFISIRIKDKKFASTCTHSLPRLVSESSLDFKQFSTLKSGIKVTQETLKEEGIQVSPRKFNLTPNRSKTSCTTTQ